MGLIVECYSGHTYAQEPRAFVWHGERHVVQEVERAWRTPEGPHFLVRTREDGFFELAYDEVEHTWSAKERLATAMPHVEGSNPNPSREDQR